MSTDPREPVYRDLHGGQLARQEALNRSSARTILARLFPLVRPGSMLDVGCGLGTWLAEASALGLDDLLGLEGPWLDPSRLAVDPGRVRILDLEQGFSLGRRFDLVVCLEVAEHLAPTSAETLVGALAEHGDLVLFSAAIPFQGGHHHVNEQFPGYWAERFERLGFRPVDLVRPWVWNDPAVVWWLRQNTLLFAHDRALAASPTLRAEAAVPRPLSVVHPDVYLARLRDARHRLDEHAELVRLLSQGGTFEVQRAPDGRFAIRRVGPPGGSGDQ